MSTDKIPSDVATCLNYTDGMFLTASSMAIEQNYFSNWIRLQNRYLYTPGVLSGLLPTQQGNTVKVDPGAGFDANGNFLVFPGDTGNVLAATRDFGDSYAIYLCYPDASTAIDKNNPDYANEAAVLKNASSTNAPDNAIKLAEVTLVAGTTTIDKIADARSGVSSRLPVTLGTNQQGAMLAVTPPPNLDGLRHGAQTIDTRTLSAPGDKVAVSVNYLPDGSQAFSVPPTAVNTNVLGEVPYAVNVTAIGTSSFQMTLTAILTRSNTTPSVQIAWFALPAAPARAG
ncbi:hypothetical protein [Burkholderia gladioli]|uniref:hypothetical protein n=1 Tax=Burkholderia gladioli TaxID=28095 RepID=UPI00163F1AEE|nr:hypothetical protein [Burkholderia gladioli]